jgi:hypothetical protein
MIAGAEAQGWIGEVEGIDLTLTFLHGKREDAHRLARARLVDLGLPAAPAAMKGKQPP